ncbi:hypothetical protein [Candidatus Tisiphia endosymbiont of Nemotelus uliginosus]|uniref:hypothetical protein n=1 Tax=Candidatus Tisiphia endosymbiont of Nemotelus uliginosus TaxID=3077926 RepID=UPI0035C8B547
MGTDTWGLARLGTLYRMICNYQSSSAKENCVSIHNPGTIYNIDVTLNTMYKAFCIKDHNIKILGFNISETTALLQNRNRVLEEQNIFLRNENRDLRLELEQVRKEKDILSNKVLNLEFDIKLLTNKIDFFTTSLTTAQNHEKELQVKLDSTTYQLQRANHSIHVVSLAVKKLRNSDVSNDDTIFFEAQKENYTNHLNSYVQDKKLTDKSLGDTHQNIETYEQEINSLRRQLQDKNIELDNTYELLNITLSHIDQIYNNVMVLNHQIQDIAKHGISKRNINNQYNEAQDDYAVSKQIMGASYEARVADSERKVEEILTIFASIEKENNILKARIPQNEGKEIEVLQSYNLTESNLKTSDITTTGQEVKNNAIINKVVDYNSGVKDDFVKSTKGNYDNKSLYVLPDDYTGNVNSTNKLIGNTEVNPYYITIGGIALSGVALYLTNKYCFAITKWPIMAYKYIARICRIFDTKVNDNGMPLPKAVEHEEDDTNDSFNDNCNIPKLLYLTPNPNTPNYINVMKAENIYEEVHIV